MGVIICLESNGFFLNSSFYAIDLLIDCSTYLKRTLAFTRFGGEGPRSFRRNAIGVSSLVFITFDLIFCFYSILMITNWFHMTASHIMTGITIAFALFWLHCFDSIFVPYFVSCRRLLCPLPPLDCPQILLIPDIALIVSRSVFSVTFTREWLTHFGCKLVLSDVTEEIIDLEEGLAHFDDVLKRTREKRLLWKKHIHSVNKKTKQQKSSESTLGAQFASAELLPRVHSRTHARALSRVFSLGVPWLALARCTVVWNKRE